MEGIHFPLSDLSLRDAVYSQIRVARGFVHSESRAWRTDVIPDELPRFEHTEIRYSDSYGHEKYGVYVNDEFAMMLTTGERAHVVACATTQEVAKQVCDYIHALYPPVEIQVDTDNVSVQFWSENRQGQYGAMPRVIEIAHWDQDRDNYIPQVAAKLDNLMVTEPPDVKSGQLILWTGVPGTGKTFALRSMADRVRDWANINYIVDPEAFFSSPRYMMAVLLGRDDEANMVFNPALNSWEAGPEKWRIIVLEDTGELLAADASSRTGQGLSRLLNITDGLVGQGLKNLVLITTNEELGRLHPAVTRPGRCLSHVKFEKFSSDQASDWLIKHDIHGSEKKSRTLAELFAEVRGDTFSGDREIGFSA